MVVELDKPQIIVHTSKVLDYTPYDTRWIPSTARLVTVGQTPGASGKIQVHSLDNGGLTVDATVDRPSAIKCCKTPADGLRRLAYGDFAGRVACLDLARAVDVWSAPAAHADIVNCIDVAVGPVEIATGSRDGAVKVWDPRVRDKPVASIVPRDDDVAGSRDTWAVAFGNSYGNGERCVAAGYENGDVKLFDLKAMKLVWETNVKNGVCAMEFDRMDIKMNKLCVGGLEGGFTTFDMRTRHPENGYASVSHTVKDKATVWITKHLPQNRDVFMTTGANGAVNLFKYSYPPQRTKKGKDDVLEGVAGTLGLLQTASVSEQPVNAFDWSPDKMGLCAFTSYDQTVRVGIVTKLNKI